MFTKTLLLWLGFTNSTSIFYLKKQDQSFICSKYITKDKICIYSWQNLSYHLKYYNSFKVKSLKAKFSSNSLFENFADQNHGNHNKNFSEQDCDNGYDFANNILFITRRNPTCCYDKISETLSRNISVKQEDFGIKYIERNARSLLYLAYKLILTRHEIQTLGSIYFLSGSCRASLSLTGHSEGSFLKPIHYYVSSFEVSKRLGPLIIKSFLLLDYIGHKSSPSKIVLQKTGTRIVDQKFDYAINSAINTFDNIDHIFNSCLLSKSKEIIFQSNRSLFLYKADKKLNSFKNISSFLQQYSSFFKADLLFREEYAKKPSFFSIQFMTSTNIIRFSHKSFVSMNQLMLLSIKKDGNHLKKLHVPVDLYFRYKIDSNINQFSEGFTRTPSNYDSFAEKDLLVSVYKLPLFQFPGSGKIVVTFYNLSSSSLRVLITTDMTINWLVMVKNSTKVSAQFPSYEVLLERQTNDSKNYLGISSASKTPGAMIKYKFQVRYFQCYSKFSKEWKSKGCKVGTETNETIIHCQCWHLSLFGGSTAIAPRQLDLKNDLQLLYLINESPQASILVLSIILIYFIVLVWTRHNDGKDRLQRVVVVLDDNFPGEEWPYLLTVYTSFWIGSGTDANIGIRLYGSKGISRIHLLNSSGQRKVLKSNCDDWFLIFTHKNLGDLEKIHIFSDYSGVSPDWHCGKIMVYDLEGQKEFLFIIERWVSLAEEDDCVDFFCYPTPTKKSLRRDRIAIDNIMFGLQETHLLFSIFSRHPRSSVTRSQRLSILVCILLVHLLTSIMFHDTEHVEPPQYSNIKRKLIIQMESTLLASPFTFIVIFCFKKSRIVTAPKNNIPMTLTSTQAVPLETGLEINQNKSNIPQKSSQDKHIKSLINSVSTLSAESFESKSGEDIKNHTEEETEDVEDESEEEDEEEEVEEEEEEQEIEEGCWKNCYKQIHAILFQLILSKTIMPVKIAEEDEKSSHIRIKWMYFAWFLCEFAIFASAFFVVIYSLKMEHDMCREWMSSCLKYSFTNVFFMAPLKITVFALILAGLYGQLHYIPSYECNTEAAVKRKLVGNRKFLSRLQILRKNECYKPLNSKKTMKIRMKQKNWRRWRIFTNFCVVWLLYLILLLEVKFIWHGLYNEARNHFKKLFDPKLSPGPITSFKAYVDYLTKVAIPAYDKAKWYNNNSILTPDIWKQEMSFLKDYTTRIVGVPRLRQQRVKPGICTVPLVLAEKFTQSLQCNPPITWTNSDRKEYTVGWAKPENLNPDPDSPWVFSDLKNSPLLIFTYKTSKCYLPGGYTAKLDYKQPESIAKVTKLVTDEWFDALTRVVFLEIFAYNANSKFISSVVSIMEKLADGSFQIHIQSASLHPLAGDFLSTLSILLIFTFYYFVRITLLFNRKGLKYLLSKTGILDAFTMVVLFVTMISVFLYKNSRKDYLYKWHLREEDDLHITRDMLLHRDLIRYETALTAVLIPIQVLHNIHFGKTIFGYLRTLVYCLKYATGFSFIILIYFICFKLQSVVNNSKVVCCLLNRSYGFITYCTGEYTLFRNLDFFSFLTWIFVNIITFLTCITMVFGYKWMKEQNKYISDFNIAQFFFEKINQARKKIKTNDFQLKKKTIDLMHKSRLRAGADTIEEEDDDMSLQSEDEIFATNRTVAETTTLSKEMNIKLDSVIEKLRDLKTMFECKQK